MPTVSAKVSNSSGLSATHTAEILISVPGGDVNPNNTVIVTNVSGAPLANHPLQFARPFIMGEIKNFAQVRANGAPLLTQCDVKNRHSDGSVKFAILTMILPKLAIDEKITLTFQNQSDGNNAPVAVVDLLTQFSDFDAVIKLTRPATITGTYDPTLANWKAITVGALSVTVDGKVYNLTGINLSAQPSIGYAYSAIYRAVNAAKVPFNVAMGMTQTVLTGGKTLALNVPTSGQDLAPLLFKSGMTQANAADIGAVSARQMLEDGNCQPWTSGPVAQTMVCADRSSVRIYDLDVTGKGFRSFHPEFDLTFWPTTGQVFVRYVGELTNTQAMEAFIADLKLTIGKATPVTVYEQSNVRHSLATRWTRTTCIGNTPEPKVNIDHNIGYLADTYFLPNYDRSLKIPESILANAYSGWNSVNYPHAKINDAGLWMKDMPGVGYHPEIGPMPVWMNRVVYSGDWRMWEIMLRQADLAGAFPVNFREGDASKKADRAQTVPGIGLPISIYARPTSWALDPRDQANAADKIVVRGSKSAGGNPDLYEYDNWLVDQAHQPDPYSVVYMLTGDPFYLDGLKFWASWGGFSTPPGTDNSSARGPGAGIYEQVRGQAWTFRTRENAAFLVPDADPFKPIFVMWVNEALAKWEGQRDIHGTVFENTPMWTWARKFLNTSGDGWSGLGPSPLGWWGSSPTDMSNTALFDPNVAANGFAGFQNDFVCFTMARAVEMGFPAQALFEWVGKNRIGQLTTPAYNPRLVSINIIPTWKKLAGGGVAHFQSWDEVLLGWTLKRRTEQNPDNPADATWPGREMLYWPSTGAEYYWDVAHGIVALSSTLPGGLAAWQKYNEVIAVKSKESGLAPNWNLDPTWAFLPRTAH